MAGIGRRGKSALGSNGGIETLLSNLSSRLNKAEATQGYTLPRIFPSPVVLDPFILWMSCLSGLNGVQEWPRDSRRALHCKLSRHSTAF